MKSNLFIKIFVSSTLAIVILFAVMYLLTVPYIQNTVEKIEENAARTILNNVYDMVEQSHLELENYRQSIILERKEQLRNILSVADARTYGHLMGDQVLITLSRLLQQRLRKTDVVGRYGGEEFAVIFTDCDLTTAIQVVDQLRESFATLRFPVGDESFSSSFSSGVASFSLFKDMESICKAADTALYKAKETGRNRVCAAAAT
ncbi:MAG: GGDEF domain-containing protein [Desulfuromonadales bacterium]